jgi:hypothetical protein
MVVLQNINSPSRAAGHTNRGASIQDVSGSDA